MVFEFYGGCINMNILIGLCALFFMLTLIAAAGQSPARSIEEDAPDNCAIWGQVFVPGRSLQEPTFVELVGKNGMTNQKVPVINGNYRFKSVAPDWYQFRISDQSGREIYRETKAVQGSGENIVISTPQARPAHSGAYTVSFAELKRTTPRKALDEYNAAVKDAANGALRTSIERLLKALEIDPHFPEARINLAVEYNRMGLHQEALQQSRRAFELNPENLEVRYRHAMLLLAAKNYQECEAVTRHVIRNQWYTAQMKAALAISLIGQRRDFAEALDYLEQAATEFPMARLLAVNTFIEIGWNEAAVNQMRTYLNLSANPCERARLETWIAAYSQPVVQKVESSHLTGR